MIRVSHNVHEENIAVSGVAGNGCIACKRGNDPGAAIVWHVLRHHGKLGWHWEFLTEPAIEVEIGFE
jgi:N-acetyl-anhydromuramyl-L-alanine amidase AmpD